MRSSSGAAPREVSGRAQGAPAGPFRVGAWRCEPRLFRVSGPEGTSQVEPKVMQVLCCLAARPGRVVTRGELLDAVWDGGAVSEQVLSRAVSELRKLFGDDPREPAVIETIAKSGYRLLVPVEPLDEAAELLAHPSLAGPAAARPRPARPRRAGFAAGLALGAVAALAGWALWSALPRGVAREPAGAGAPIRASLLLPAEAPPELGIYRSLALSPDGRTLVYGGWQDGVPRLYRRRLDRGETEPLAGTEGGMGPFFSADGRHVAFYAAGKLRRVPVEGGDPVTLFGDASDPLGASWGADGTIVFVRRWLEGLWWLPPAGAARPLTELRGAAGERSHFWPELLPGGRHLLFTVWRGGGVAGCDVELLELATGARRTLLRRAADARYLPDGRLLFVRPEGLAEVAFDLGRLEPEGAASPVVGDLLWHPVSGAGHFAASADGLLVWASPASLEPRRSLARVDAAGRGERLALEPPPGDAPRFSPDGSRLAATRDGPQPQIWLHDLERGRAERLSGGGQNVRPVWRPDGTALAFGSDRSGPFNLYLQPARGGVEAERLTTSEHLQLPSSWSPDGEWLAYSEFHPERRWDIWLLPLAGDRVPVPFLTTPFDELRPQISPDGSLVAYVSNEAGRWDERGRWEVYLRPLADQGVRIQVSTGGGDEPRWSRDGGRLYFRRADRLLSVPVRTRPELAVGEPRPELGDLRLPESIDLLSGYELGPDGRFLVLREAAPPRASELHLLTRAP